MCGKQKHYHFYKLQLSNTQYNVYLTYRIEKFCLVTLYIVVSYDFLSYNILTSYHGGEKKQEVFVNYIFFTELTSYSLAWFHFFYIC